MKKLYFVFLLIFIYIFSLNVFADGGHGGHGGSTSLNQAEKLLNYVCDSAKKGGQLLYGLGEDVIYGIDNAYAIYLYQFVPESELSMGQKQLIAHFTDINDGSENPSIVFDIDDSFNWTIKDEFKADYDSLIDKLCTNINNQYLLYPTHDGNFINKFNYPNFNPQNAIDSLSYYNGDDFPLYCERGGVKFYSVSLENLDNNSNTDADGFIFNNGDWNYIVEYWDIYVSHGYLPNVNNANILCSFNVYSNNVKYNQRDSFKYQWGSSIFPQPFYIYPYYYYDYWEPGYCRDVSCLIGKTDIPMLFFRDYTSYSNFYNSKQAIPINFSGLDIPENFDYSDFFRNIDSDLIDNTHSLNELYSYLSNEFSKKIDQINDNLKDTNSLLREIRNFIRDDIVDTFGTRTSNGPKVYDILLSILQGVNPDSDLISTNMNTILQDPSLKNRLKHIFPFGVFQDCNDLIDYFANIPIKSPRFEFNVDLFHNEVNDYQEIVIDLEEIPHIDIFRAIWFFMIIILLNLGLLALEYKFLCMFFGGG